jgi:hypothetical protein
MLAQSFKTAEELGLPEKQVEALKKTLVLLETGKLIHQKINDLFTLDERGEYTGHFNMQTWNKAIGCGTVCCIGGTAELIGGVEFLGTPDALYALFYPETADYQDITPSQAATALRSYLTTGKANWKEVLKTP